MEVVEPFEGQAVHVKALCFDSDISFLFRFSPLDGT
jgi:hypothetical protein